MQYAAAPGLPGGNTHSKPAFGTKVTGAPPARIGCSVFLAGVLVFGLASLVDAAESQIFPTRPVRLIVANTPGSAPDVIARLVSAKLSEIWKQQIVVDNRPGATGLIAAEALARAAPDGYTLWLNTMTQLISTLQAQRHMQKDDRRVRALPLGCVEVAHQFGRPVGARESDRFGYSRIGRERCERQCSPEDQRCAHCVPASIQRFTVAYQGNGSDDEQEQRDRPYVRSDIRRPAPLEQDTAKYAQKVRERQHFADPLRPFRHAAFADVCEQDRLVLYLSGHNATVPALGSTVHGEAQATPANWPGSSSSEKRTARMSRVDTLPLGPLSTRVSDCCSTIPVGMIMDEDTFSAELRSARARRAYWQAQYDAARAADDVEGVAHALQHLRQYDWLIGWIEGARNPH